MKIKRWAMTREELIRDEDYTEEEAEKMVLQNKLDKANERIEELEDRINTAKNLIKDFIKLNLQVVTKPKDYSSAMVNLYKTELGTYRKLEKLLSDK